MAKKVQYTIEAIDVDGDGVQDGDLVTKYVNGKIHSRKFVPLAQLKKKLKQTNLKPSIGEKPQKLVYKQVPQNMENTSKPVIIQESTNFGQYVKAGAGMTVGSLAVNTVFDGLASLFSDD